MLLAEWLNLCLLSLQDALDLRLLGIGEVQLLGHSVKHPTFMVTIAAMSALSCNVSGKTGSHGQHAHDKNEKLLRHWETPFTIRAPAFPGPRDGRSRRSSGCQPTQACHPTPLPRSFATAHLI